jgi:hypothetical protein
MTRPVWLPNEHLPVEIKATPYICSSGTNDLSNTRSRASQLSSMNLASSMLREHHCECLHQVHSSNGHAERSHVDCRSMSEGCIWQNIRRVRPDSRLYASVADIVGNESPDTNTRDAGDLQNAALASCCCARSRDIVPHLVGTVGTTVQRRRLVEVSPSARCRYTSNNSSHVDNHEFHTSACRTSSYESMQSAMCFSP